MGFLSKLKSKFSGTKTISLDSSLGNVLISGNSQYGKNQIFTNYLIDAHNNNSAIIVIRSSSNGFSVIPHVTTSSSMVYNIDTADNAFTEQIDLFKYLNDTQVSDTVFNVFNRYSEFDMQYKMRFKEYISKMKYFLKTFGKRFKLNELYNYSIEDFEDMNYRSNLPDFEKRKNERFFDGLRSDIGILESYFYDFQQNNAGFILSGDRSLEEIVNSGKIVEINLDFSSRKEESEMILGIILDYICKFNYSKLTNKNSLVVLVDEIPNEILVNSKFEKIMTSSVQCRAVYTISDIAHIAEKSNLLIDKADSIFFFQQNSNQNKEYCSEFFGTYEKQKVSTTKTYGTSRTRGSSSSYSGSYGSGYGSSSSGSNRSYGSNRSTSNTISTEKERVYLPDVFGTLPQNQCIYFFRSSNSHNRLNL